MIITGDFMKHIFKYRARYVECDQMGYVHNSVYYIYFEEARSDLLRANQYSYSRLENDDGVMLPLIESNAKFKQPIKYDEEIIIEVSFSYIKKISCKIDYIIKKLNGEVACEGYTIHAFMDSKKRKLRRIPGEVISIIEKYLN